MQLESFPWRLYERGRGRQSQLKYNLPFEGERNNCHKRSVAAVLLQLAAVWLQVRFIVMNNLFQTDLHVQRKYDLKGSTQGRFSGKVPTPNTILKDLDLDMSLKLEEGWHERYAATHAEESARHPSLAEDSVVLYNLTAATPVPILRGAAFWCLCLLYLYRLGDLRTRAFDLVD